MQVVSNTLPEIAAILGGRDYRQMQVVSNDCGKLMSLNPGRDYRQMQVVSNAIRSSSGRDYRQMQVVSNLMESLITSPEGRDYRQMQVVSNYGRDEKQPRIGRDYRQMQVVSNRSGKVVTSRRGRDYRQMQVVSGGEMRAYQYRIYSTKEQGKHINQLLLQSRRVWNVLWNEYKIIWNRDDLTQSKSWQAQTKRMRALIQKHPDTYGLLHNDTISLIGQRFGWAWSAAFKKRKKGEPWEPPQYKHKHTYGLPLRYRGRSCKYEPANGKRYGKLTILNVPGVLKVREHRKLPDLPIKQINIRSERDGKWYASFVFDESAEVSCKRHGPPVGIDLGLKTRVAVSDGRCNWLLKSPRWLDEYEAAHRRADRICSRRRPKPGQKGSSRYRKAKQQRAKLAAKIARCRADWLHNATSWIAESFEHVYCEDLQPVFMLKNKHMSKAAADAAFGEFKRMLAYKCGGRVTFVDPAYTTQTCSRCGNVKPKELSERMHKCDKCGLVMDRDANAARNILARGLKQEKGAAA